MKKIQMKKKIFHVSIRLRKPSKGFIIGEEGRPSQGKAAPYKARDNLQHFL